MVRVTMMDQSGSVAGVVAMTGVAESFSSRMRAGWPWCTLPMRSGGLRGEGDGSEEEEDGREQAHEGLPRCQGAGWGRGCQAANDG